MLGGADRRHPGRPADRLAGRRRPPRGACWTPRRRSAGHRGRHARAARGQGAVRRPRPGRGRRAAPVRRRAAGRADRQERRHPAARAGDDRDADPADRGDDRLRRPGGLDARASCPAGRAPIQTNVVPLRRAARPGSSGPGSGSARRSRKGHQVVRRLPADRRRRAETPTTGTASPRTARRTTRSAAVEEVGAELAAGPLRGLRVEVLHGRLPADEKDAVMRRFAAGEIDVLVVDHGDRGRRRRRQRHDDGGAGRRPVRRLPAAPAARPGRPRRPAGAVPAGHRGAGRLPRPRAAGRGGRDHRRVRAVPGRPRAAARGRRARRLPVRAGAPACGCCTCSSTRTSSSRPARSPPRRRRADPDLAGHPTLARRRCRPRLLRRADAAPSYLEQGVTRIIGGSRRRAADQGARRRRAPGRPPTGSARRCSPPRRRARLADGLPFLDLYAGSGAVGLEARSRGAGVVMLVEHDRRTAAGDPGEHRAPSGFPASTSSSPPVAPGPRAAARARRTTWCSSTRRTPCPSSDVERRARRRCATRLARATTRWSWSSGPARRRAGRGRTGSPRDRTRKYGETTLWYGHAHRRP